MSEEKIWDRMKQGFENVYHEGEKAAGAVAGSLEEMGHSARAQLDKARFERQLFKRLAELGGAVYELDKARRQMEDTAGRQTTSVLEDPDVRRQLEAISAIDLKIWDAQHRVEAGGMRHERQ